MPTLSGHQSIRCIFPPSKRDFSHNLLLPQAQLPRLECRRKYFSIKFLSEFVNNQSNINRKLSKKTPDFHCKVLKTFDIAVARTNVFQIFPLCEMGMNYHCVNETIDIEVSQKYRLSLKVRHLGM
jgi:hypothetical protein